MDKPKRKNSEFTYPEDSFLGAIQRLEIAKRNLYEAIDETFHVEDRLTNVVEWLANQVRKLNNR